MFFSKGDAFEGLNDHPASVSQAITLDSGLLDIDVEAIQAILDIEFLRIKKNLLIKQCIQKYCKEDFGLVDLFSNGYVTELGLAMNKEVICLVETIEDQRNMGTRLLDFTKRDRAILDATEHQWGIDTLHPEPIHHSSSTGLECDPSSDLISCKLYRGCPYEKHSEHIHRGIAIPSC